MQFRLYNGGMQTSPWQLRILGTFELAKDGNLVDSLGQRRDEELIAYLAVTSPTLTTRDTIARTLWPDLEVDVGRRNLSLHLFQAKKRLVEAGVQEPIESVRKRLKLNDSIAVDAHAFMNELAAATTTSAPTLQVLNLDAAIHMYGSGLLPEFSFSWLGVHRQRMESLYSHGTKQLVHVTGKGEAITGLLRGLPPTIWKPQTTSQSPEEWHLSSLPPGAALSRHAIDEIQEFVHGTAAKLLETDYTSAAQEVASREREILSAAMQLLENREYVPALRLLIPLRGYWLKESPRAGSAILRHVLDAAIGYPDELSARGLEIAGSASYEIGELQQSVELLKSALFYWRDMGNKTELARTLANLGRSLSDLAQYHEAEECYAESLVCARQLDTKALFIAILLNAAKADIADQNPSRALSRLEKRMGLLQTAGETSGQVYADTVSHIAAAHLLAGNLGTAEQFSTKALQAYQAIHQQKGVSICASQLGQAAYFQADWANARMHAQRAVAAAQASRSTWHIGQALGYQALIQEAAGDGHAAATMWDAICKLRSVGDRAEIERFRSDMRNVHR